TVDERVVIARLVGFALAVEAGSYLPPFGDHEPRRARRLLVAHDVEVRVRSRNETVLPIHPALLDRKLVSHLERAGAARLDLPRLIVQGLDVEGRPALVRADVLHRLSVLHDAVGARRPGGDRDLDLILHGLP